MLLEDRHPVTRLIASRGRVIVIDLVIWFVSALSAEPVTTSSCITETLGN
jgi:hypothetical protein